MPVSLTKEESYSSQHLAKKAKMLNNKASFLIAESKYEEGAVLLKKALKAIEWDLSSTNNIQEKTTICKYCGLESFLAITSENEDDSFDSYYHHHHHHHDEEQHHHHQHKKVNKDPHHDDAKMNYDSKSNSNGSSTRNNGFIYRRPFLVHDKCIKEMHSMGNALLLIILFNLALAYHLKITESNTRANFNMDSTSGNSNSSGNNNNTSLIVLRKALQLYGAAYQRLLLIHYDDDDDSNNHSHRVNSNGLLRLTMIISNNLGEIHRFIGNAHKRKMCLQHLLSTIMLLVDYNSNYNLVNDNDLVALLNSTEMDGFYYNVSSIMMLNGGGRDIYCGVYYAKAV
jgi:hypothetical protein